MKYLMLIVGIGAIITGYHFTSMGFNQVNYFLLTFGIIGLFVGAGLSWDGIKQIAHDKDKTE